MPPSYPYEQSAPPVQFVSPGQLFYNPPPTPQQYKYGSSYAGQSPTSTAQLAEKAKVRPLSVDEALQFSALSSIVPFDAGLIPMVNANASVSNSAFQNEEEQRAGKQKLRALDDEVSSTHSRSHDASHMLQSVKELIQPKDPIPLKFKAQGQRSANTGSELSPVATPRLGSFAKMVMHQIKLPYRFVTPETPRAATVLDAKQQTSPVKMSPSQQASSLRQPALTPSSKKQPTHQQNESRSQAVAPQQTKKRSSPPQTDGKLEPPTSTPTEQVQKVETPQDRPVINSGGAPAPSQPTPPRLSPPVKAEQMPGSPQRRLVPAVPAAHVPPHHQLVIKVPPVSDEHRAAVQFSPSKPLKSEPSSEPGLQVVIGTGPLSEPKDNYKVFSDRPGVISDRSLTSSQKVVGSSQYVEQSAAADECLAALSEVLSDLFESDAASQANGLSDATQGILTSGNGPDRQVIILALSFLVKIDSCLRKVIERRRFEFIPSEQIMSLQAICERSFLCEDDMQIHLQNDWPGLEEIARDVQANTCEQILKSARIILRTMTSGRQDKQILSEERLQKCIAILEKVVDSLILPCVEARSTGTEANIFQLATASKKSISGLLFECGKLMQLLLDVLGKEEIGESTVNRIEYFVIRMLFVENAPSEKESVLGIAKFENFRRFAMLILVQIFSRYTEQRQDIIREVLTSLQKLPTARQHGRQFKLENGKRLQLTTVLLIRLVQSSGVNTIPKSAKFSLRTGDDEADDDDDANSVASDEPQQKMNDSEDDQSDAEDDLVPSKLLKVVRKLQSNAIQSAWHIVSFLVSKASTASKSGEQPHRHILDMFVEDLVVVLGLPEWPGAELLLQTLVSKMMELSTNTGKEKTAAPVKVMALETLGTLGTAILDITSEAQHTSRSLENDGSQFTIKLMDQLDSHLQGQLTDFDVAKWTGPFRAVMDRLERADAEGRTSSSQGFLLTKWIKTLMWGTKGVESDLDEKRLNGRARELAITLCQMARKAKWENADPIEVNEGQARLAYLVTILHIGFCQSFAHILSLLMQSITSEQITVRTRSLKSVTQMLEKDPALLDRHPQVINLILRCTTDSSSLVKDNSLALLGKCITLRPSVEEKVLQTILNGASDPTVGIRKRALKLLRDSYLRNDTKDARSDSQRQWRLKVRSLAANSIFCRTSDEEESVTELAHQIFEEIWVEPFRSFATRENFSSSESLLIREQITVIIKVLMDHDGILPHIEDLFKHALSTKGKDPISSRKIFRTLVSNAFEGFIDTSELPDAPSQAQVLQALGIFARTEPKLFTTDHVEILKPYVSCLNSNEDLQLFRGVVVIFRHVLPTLPSLQQETLKKVHADLMQVIQKLPKAELDEVTSCLWTISSVLHTEEKLAKLTISVLKRLAQMQARTNTEAEVSQVQRVMRIAGHFGKYCDFQPQLELFRKELPALKGELVAGMIVSGLQPFTSSGKPLNCKAVAWEAIGIVCQSWPKTFNHVGIAKEIQSILQGSESDLQRIVLASIRDFFTTQDQAHDTETNALTKDPLNQGKLGGSMTATDKDEAASLIAQNYLQHILRIALSTVDDIALTATEVITSIAKQGLCHPKDLGPALVALATSPNQKIVKISHEQLKSLHSQHETFFEREYMRAVHEAFIYHRDVVKDPSGFTGSPPRAKLFHVYEVIRESKPKFLVKFLTNFCNRTDFELPKLDVTAEIPAHLQYSRFLLENLVFLDFKHLDDINLVLGQLEKIVAATGSIVAHAINTDIFNVTVESVLNEPDLGVNGNQIDGIVDGMHLPVTSIEPPAPDITPARLRQLAVASTILTMIWEARKFLQRLYNVTSGQNKGRGRSTKSKESREKDRAPTKNGLVSGDKFLETILSTVRVLDSEKTSIDRCKQFSELMAVDDERKVPNGDEEDVDFDAMGEDDLGMDDFGRGTKRKQSTPSSSTPKKKRSRPSKSGSRMSSEDVDMWE